MKLLWNQDSVLTDLMCGPMTERLTRILVVISGFGLSTRCQRREGHSRFSWAKGEWPSISEEFGLCVIESLIDSWCRVSGSWNVFPLMISNGHLHLVSQGLSGNDGLPGNKGFKVGKIQILLNIIVRFLLCFNCESICFSGDSRKSRSPRSDWTRRPEG